VTNPGGCSKNIGGGALHLGGAKSMLGGCAPPRWIRQWFVPKHYNLLIIRITYTITIRIEL
jgi:hypothetical protein